MNSLPPRLWTILLNPAAGRGSKSRAALENALAQNVGWEIIETASLADLQNRTREIAARNEPNHGIAAAGGDGTLSAVANIVYQTGNSTVLGVIPMGTGNDFARCLGIGTSIELAVQTLFSGEIRALDAAKITCDGREQIFLNVAGCGFDSAVAERMNRPNRQLNGTLVYLWESWQTLQRFRAAQLTIEIEGEIRREPAMLCAVANASSYGGGMLIAPSAKLDDGELDICLIAKASRGEFLGAFPTVFRGKHLAHPKVSSFRTRQIRVESQPQWPVLADGEIIGKTPFEIEVLEGALRFVVPVWSRWF